MNTKKQILHHPQRFQRAKEIKVVQSFKLARIKNKIWYQKQILDHPKKIPSKKRPRSFKKQLDQRKWTFHQNHVSHHDQQFEGDLRGTFDQNDVSHHDQHFEPLLPKSSLERLSRDYLKHVLFLSNLSWRDFADWH